MSSSLGQLLLLAIAAGSGVHGLALNNSRHLSEYASPMDVSWTAWFSEENGGYSEDRQYGVMGAHCKENYCDDLQLYQGCSGELPTVASLAEWTDWFSEEAKSGQTFGHETCKSGYIMTRMQCRNSNCDDKRLRCTKVDTTKFTLGTPVWEAIEFSDDGHPAPWYMCSVQFGVVTGWACYGKKCDNQKLQCASLVPSSWTMAPATFGWTGYFGSAQEYSPASHYPITAIRCQGHQCSTLDLYQGTSGIGIETGSMSYWTSSFSEEGDHEGKCKPNYLVTRIKCMKDDCDDKMLQCTVINLAKNAMLATEFIGETFSEEGISRMGQCRPDGYFMTGLQCFGGRCDNLKVICKKVVSKDAIVHPAETAPVGMWVDKGQYYKSMMSRTSVLKVCTQDSTGKKATRAETSKFANQVKTSLEIKYTIGSTLGLAATTTETTFGLAYTATTETANTVSDTITSSSMMTECRQETISCDANCWTEMERLQPGAASATLWQWVVIQQGDINPFRNLGTFVFVPEGHVPFCPPRTQVIGDMLMTRCKPGTFKGARRLLEPEQWV